MSGLRALCAVCFLAPVAALASPLERVDLDPIQHQEARLVIVDDAGNETIYSPADIEAFQTYRMVTTTPWRPDPAAFEGVLLSDLLARHGLDDNAALRFIAENEYETDFGRAVWTAADVIVATRVDGKAHSRRARGPIQIMVHKDDYDREVDIGERHLVWMLRRIEPMD